MGSLLDLPPTATVVGQPQVTYTYDNTNRLTTIAQSTSTVTIAYDDADRRTSVTYPNTNKVEYAYNAASELTTVTYKQGTTTLGTLTYTYDGAGNRLQAGGTFARTNLPPTLTSGTYNTNNQQTAFGTTTYTWNARNQLIGICGPSLTYDSFGRRTGKTVNGTTTNFLYEGLNPVQEKNGGTVTANVLTGLGIDELFTRTDSVGVRALLPDALGSTVALGDSSGALQTQYTYEPFGVTTQTGAASTSSYKYTGREDDGTGLYYYRARYYQPQLQRFIAEDPIGFLGGDVNLYGYVGNNPILLRDPMGLLTLGQGSLLGCGLGGVGGGIGAKKSKGLGAAAGGGLGCAFGTLSAVPGLIPLPPTPLWLGIGALTGGIAGGLAAAAGGGTLTDIAISTAAGAVGGAVANASTNPVLGASVGAAVSIAISSGAGLFQQGFNTPVSIR